MTVLTHQAQAGVTATLRLFTGNAITSSKLVPGRETGFHQQVTANAQGLLTWNVPDVLLAGSLKGVLLQVSGIPGNPVVRLKRGVSTTVSAALVSATTAEGSLPDRTAPTAAQIPDVSADIAAARDTDPEREQYIPARLSPAQLKADYGPRAPRPGALLAIATGDSTTMGDSVHPGGWQYSVNPGASLPDGTYPPVGPFEYRQGPRSWFQHACWLSNGRLRPLFNAGQGSDRTPGMLARFPLDVIAKKPDIVFIGDARNDWSVVAEATTRANILAMIQMAQDAGIIVVLVSVYPDDSTNTSAQNRKHNAWLKKVAQEKRLMFVDRHAAVVDPADGTYLAAMQTDGVHSSYAGAQAAGAKVIADLAGFLSGTMEWLPSDNTTDINLMPNALNVVSSAFYGNGLVTQAFETDAASYPGRATVGTFTGAGALRQDLVMASRGIAIGDRLKWVGKARVRNAVAGNMRWNLEFSAPGVGSYVVRPVDTTASGMDMPWFIFEAEFVVPAGAATIARVGANVISGTGEISLAQQGVYNLTKTG